MYKSTFGTKNQIQFKNENEFYELLGYLGFAEKVFCHRHNVDKQANKLITFAV